MNPFIDGIHQVSSLYRNFGEQKKHLSLFLPPGITLNYAFSRFCETKLARSLILDIELGYIKEIATICIKSLQTMSDKSSRDTFRK